MQQRLGKGNKANHWHDNYLPMFRNRQINYKGFDYSIKLASDETHVNIFCVYLVESAESGKTRDRDLAAQIDCSGESQGGRRRRKQNTKRAALSISIDGLNTWTDEAQLGDNMATTASCLTIAALVCVCLYTNIMQ